MKSLTYILTLTILISIFPKSLWAIGPKAVGEGITENDNERICIAGNCDSDLLTFVATSSLFTERWDSLPQTLFWRKIIKTSPDSGFLNISSTRQILSKWSTKEWCRLTGEQRERLLDSLQKSVNLGENEQLLFTTGKKDFYTIEPILSSIDKAVKIFENENTDPFYAQAILLIESPGRLQKSTVGAYGSFQLMRSVAIRMGLTVNKRMDERKDFNRSAWAAAKLLRTICIPETKYMLERQGISYNEHDLWFRLLVLHVYHAGAGNVAPILDKICPSTGNRDLIMQIWQTSHGAFRNSSQNYSQLALASLLELNELVVSKAVFRENSK